MQGQMHVHSYRAARRCDRLLRICPITIRTTIPIDIQRPYRETVSATVTACCPSVYPRPASMQGPQQRADGVKDQERHPAHPGRPGRRVHDHVRHWQERRDHDGGPGELPAPALDPRHEPRDHTSPGPDSSRMIRSPRSCPPAAAAARVSSAPGSRRAGPPSASRAPPGRTPGAGRGADGELELNRLDPRRAAAQAPASRRTLQRRRARIASAPSARGATPRSAPSATAR